MKYERLDVYTFGAELLRTGDLDPIYVMLHRAIHHRPQLLSTPSLARWLMAYWLFYHAGVSTELSGYAESHFWLAVRDRVLNDPRVPRGVERRHFRGERALEAVERLSLDSPGGWVRRLAEPRTFRAVASRVQQMPMFGPWIAFKVADMLERVWGAEIDFRGCELGFYSEPKKAAQMLDPLSTLDVVVERLVEHFREYTAPPRHERRVNVQEIETILCKWKSHMGGHYPLGKDTHEVREGMQGFGPTARRMAELLP